MNTKSYLKSFAIAAGLLVSGVTGFAQNFNVLINTTALQGSLSAPFSLDFQLNSGDTLGNNSAYIGSFFVSGGSLLGGSASTFGDASGSLASGVSLVDSTPFNEFFQDFTVGSSISFDVSLTQHADAGPTPDGFSIALLDGDLFNIATTGFANQLVFTDLPGSIQTFSGTGAYEGVTVTVTAIPEPGTYAAIIGVAVFAVIAVRRRRQALNA